MRHSIYAEREGQDAFTDLLFNALLGFAFMFVAAFALMRDPDDTGKIDAKAEVLDIDRIRQLAESKLE